MRVATTTWARYRWTLAYLSVMVTLLVMVGLWEMVR